MYEERNMYHTMIRTRTYRYVLGLAFLLASVVKAQQAFDLSLDQALQIGFDKSKGLHASMMQVQYADAKSGVEYSLQNRARQALSCCLRSSLELRIHG